MARYFRNLLAGLDEIALGIDRFLNALSGGDPGETISSRAGKRADQGNRAAIAFCWVVGLALGKRHCQRAEQPEEGADAVL